MNITLETYDNALQGFLNDVGMMKDDVDSVLLFGSMARGDVKPGRSDVMDAFIFLKPEVFRDRERYLRDLKIMVGCCERLSLSGLVYHPFLYRDNSDQMSALFLPVFLSERASRLVFGKEMRSTIDGSPASRFYARRVFFATRRAALQMSSLLRKPRLSKSQCKLLVDELQNARKYVPLRACMAMDIWTGEPDLIPELRKALPGLNTTVLDNVKLLRDEPERFADPEALRQLLRDMLYFLEELHKQLLNKLREAGELPEA
jgi:predicted nucleotidyltransferase